VLCASVTSDGTERVMEARDGDIRAACIPKRKTKSGTKKVARAENSTSARPTDDRRELCVCDSWAHIEDPCARGGGKCRQGRNATEECFKCPTRGTAEEKKEKSETRVIPRLYD
jgi:hypothetical protein